MILYTIGNTNLKTVELVARAISDNTVGTKSRIQKIYIFNTIESSRDEYLSKQAQLYRTYLGNTLRVEEILIDKNGLIDPNVTAEVFDNKSKKIIDITNGQKTTAALLYLVASLINMDSIFYVKLKVKPDELPALPTQNVHFDYVNVPIFNEVPNLAKISQYDLIYYLLEIKKIFYASKSKKLKNLQEDISNSVSSYFSKKSYRSCISDAATCSELIVGELKSFLTSYPPAQHFTNSKNLNWQSKNIFEGVISFFDAFSREGMKESNISPLITIGGILSALRIYRNLAAHSGKNGHVFQPEDARTVINLAVELLRCSKASPQFWKTLQID